MIGTNMLRHKTQRNNGKMDAVQNCLLNMH